jgi:hypothetical protein
MTAATPAGPPAPEPGAPAQPAVPAQATAPEPTASTPPAAPQPAEPTAPQQAAPTAATALDPTAPTSPAVPQSIAPTVPEPAAPERTAPTALEPGVPEPAEPAVPQRAVSTAQRVAQAEAAHPVAPVRYAPPARPWPGEKEPSASGDPDAPLQQPVLPSFVWGALYGFLVRTACFLLSVTALAPLNGPLTFLIRGINPGLGETLMLAEFFVLGLAAMAAVVVGAATRDGSRPALVRALFFGRVYFWGTVWYLAMVVVGSFYVIGWETAPGGIWLLILGCLNLPLLWMSRKIIVRTRWVATAPPA